MRRRRSPDLFANSLMLWTDLALKTGEMMAASAQVIGHRTNRMVKAGHKPSTRDQREFTLMGQEKIEAAAKSIQAMAAKMMAMNPLLGPRALKQMMTGATALMSLASSRSISQSLARQAKLARVMTQSATTASQLSKAAAGLAQQGLKPIHSRATANAKRLGKR